MARWVRRAAAFCVLAAVAVVAPAVMTHLAGWPLPRHLPTGTQIQAVLAHPLSPGAVLYALAAAIWLTWAMLAVSVASEILAALRGHPAPRLPVLPPAQALAAALVSALALTPAANTRTATAASPAATPTAPAQTRTGHMPAAAGDASPLLGFSARERGIVTGDRIYRVAPGDTLWSIAAAELGDPWRWREIYTLNRGRAQPSGRRLDDPALIYPGWTLRLPTSPTPASRPASHPRPHHPAPPAGPTPATRHPAPGRHRATPRPPAGHPPSTAARPGSPWPGGNRGGGIHLPGGGLAGVTLAAAISAALLLASVQRRRRYRPAPDLTSSLLPGEPALPAAVAALRRATVPGRAPLDAEPGMVPLGVRDGQEISVSIAALGGLGLTGPGATAAARAILAGLLARAVPGQPGGPAEVIVPAADAALLLPGYHRDDISQDGLPGLIITPSLDTALGEAEALIVRRARMSGSADTGDDPPEDPAARSLPVAALITSPARAASQRLRAVLESGRGQGVAGILLGDWPPGITCHVAAGGSITSADPVLDGIQLFNLGAADTAAVISLLRQACGPPGGGHYPAPGDIPAGAGAPPPPGGASPAGPHTAQSPAVAAGAGLHPDPGASRPAQPPREEAWPAGGSARPQQARTTPGPPGGRAVRVEVLGPLRITARGTEIRGGLRKARELAAFLAVHPDGVSGETISEALWPESAPGHSARQCHLAVRKLRDLLRAAAGLTGPMLVTLTAGRYRLDPSFITTDVASFQAALDDARHAADDAARLAACQEAAALYRGPLAEGAGYDWTEPYAEAARRRALDAWTRIAELLEPGDPDQALAALETALGHDPFNEYLYQRIMRLQAAAGRPDAVRRTLRLLETRLSELGVTPAAQTRQAAAALLGMPAPPPRSGPQPPPPPRPAPPGQRPPGRRPAR